MKPDGRVLLLEHVRPRNTVLGWMADRLAPGVSRPFGPDSNRRNRRVHGRDRISGRATVGLSILRDGASVLRISGVSDLLRLRLLAPPPEEITDMAASAIGFEINELNLTQVLAVKTSSGVSGLELRPLWDSPNFREFSSLGADKEVGC